MNGFIAQKQLGTNVAEPLPATAAATEAEAFAHLTRVTGLGPKTAWAKLGYSVVPAELPEPASGEPVESTVPAQ
jgi:hypothetical protein